MVYLDECDPHDQNYIGEKKDKQRKEHHVTTSREAMTLKAILLEHLHSEEGLQRNMVRHDYVELNTGSNQRLTQGNTAV